MLQLGRAFVFFALLVASLLAASPWPAVDSDLPPDPTVHWGILPNGVRYAVRPNVEPKNRVSIRLLVAAGSLQERDNERGLAHFLEHMVFRGTRQHPNGSLIATLQRLGVGFGPDNTAFTFWDHTIYQLELPNTTAATLREGLSVFREYAEDVTFDPALIDRERDVVLNERDTRDTPDARSGNANLAFLWPKSRQVQREPIGLESAIRTFTRDQFVAFYDAWYRPERLAVIVVGDVDPAMAVNLVTEVFASLKARGPARDDPIDDVPPEASKPDVKVFMDPALPGASCTFENPCPDPRVRDTHAHRVSELQRNLAFSMLQRRIMRTARNSKGRYVSPVASVSQTLPGWSLALLGASGKIKDWHAFMADIEQEHRRAYLHGFTVEELRLARAAYLTSLNDAVRSSSTWPSPWIASQIADSMLRGTVFTTPAEYQRDLAPELSATTPAACLSAFRHAWGKQAPHIFIATNSQFHVTPYEIADALNASRTIDVPPPPESKPITFAYTGFGPAGKIVRQEHAADLDIWQAEFANGTRLNFKPTPFEANTVALCVRVGEGRLSQPRDAPGLDLLADAIVSHGGLGRHSQEELQDLIAAHTIALSFTVDTDAFGFNARCARGDLTLCLQLVAAYLTDTAYRDSAMSDARASFGSMYSSIIASPAGPISLGALRILSGGDQRFGIALPAELDSRTIPEVRAWLEPQFKHGPIELGLAGDTTWDEVSAAVASTLAALPPRLSRDNLTPRPPLKPLSKPPRDGYSATTEQKLHQVALSWYCIVPDLAGIHQERRCRLLASLLSDRLRVRLRDELGAAYGCEAEFEQLEGFPNLSYFTVNTAVAPEHARRAIELVRDAFESMRKQHISDDEFARVRQPFLRTREEDLRNNDYWAYTVLRDAQQRPDRLAEARDRTSDTAAITRRDLEEIAAKYFKASHWVQFVAYPGSEFRPLTALKR